MAENDLIQANAVKDPANANLLKKISEFISTSTHVTISRGISIHFCHYINLRTQQMFDNLVNLYANVFFVHWRRYRDCIECYSPPPGVRLHIYAARCYISMWFVDLYASNREVVRKHFPLAFIERYDEELLQTSHKYDQYLTLLNASIRPTCLKHYLDDAAYIPIVVDSLNDDKSNPFGIKNFTPLKICYKFARMMNRRGLGLGLSHSTVVSDDAMGRGWWLFDWYADKRACSWFPPDGNYDLEDVTLAYILGTACTANLGPRDADEWQYFADGLVPEYLDPKRYERVSKRRFFGSHEVRTMEVDAEFSIARALAAAEGKNDQLTKEGQQDYQLTPRFKLIDWVYLHKVIFYVDDQGRDRAHRLFFDNIPESLW
ncbi:hypothetical protein QVD17_18287 [Tagetes erecta]|uniref:Uncharacterized protein n=1 Tax=Tagetes erecta TaxID=13708 RepID=A0AAD8KHU1_TARER|nr:hypothetical protein QVD17_18287 [Tagetes erecta]